jgi:hypothetical protein
LAVRFVMVIVRVAAGLVAVTMPKSSSFGEKATGFGAVVIAGMEAVCGVVLSAWTVRVPGLDEELVRAMVHSVPGEQGGGAVVSEGEVGGGELEICCGGAAEVAEDDVGACIGGENEAWRGGLRIEFGEVGCGAGAFVSVAGAGGKCGGSEGGRKCGCRIV